MKRIRKIQSLELADDLSILNVQTLAALERLQGKNDYILETSCDYFLLKESVAFRFVKPRAMPKILPAKEITYNPDASRFKVIMDAEELLAFAVLNNLLVFETGQEYVVPSEVTMIATKKAKEVKA